MLFNAKRLANWTIPPTKLLIVENPSEPKTLENAKIAIERRYARWLDSKLFKVQSFSPTQLSKPAYLATAFDSFDLQPVQ